MDFEDSGFRFRNWDIYIDARKLRKQILSLTEKFPDYEKFTLTVQLRRALNSILLNIAEGSNRYTDKETRQFINRAHGSLDEVVACLDCALDDKYITTTNHSDIIIRASDLAKRIRAFCNHLNKSQTP